MSVSEDISLLGHLDTPVLVGDPDGCVVYANTSFRERFAAEVDVPMGQPLAMVFVGGAREAILAATAQVLERGRPARFRIREDGRGYAGLCSPIEADEDRVGVVMVMLEEPALDESLAVLASELSPPLSDASRSLVRLSDQLEGQLSEAQALLLETSLEQVEKVLKGISELALALRGGKGLQARFDVASAILRVTERVAQERSARVHLEVLMPPNLPRASGATAAFERLFADLVRQRLDESRSDQPVTVLARALGGDRPTGVLVSVVDLPDEARRGPTGHPPEGVQQGLAQMGGDAVCVEDGEFGRVTSLRLAMAAA